MCPLLNTHPGPQGSQKGLGSIQSIKTRLSTAAPAVCPAWEEHCLGEGIAVLTGGSLVGVTEGHICDVHRDEVQSAELGVCVCECCMYVCSPVWSVDTHALSCVCDVKTEAWWRSCSSMTRLRDGAMYN